LADEIRLRRAASGIVSYQPREPPRLGQIGASFPGESLHPPVEEMTSGRRFDSLTIMTTLEDIEKALTQLPADQLAEFRAWFEAFEAARFNENIEQDAKAGRLAEQALADFRAGRAREL
jgi:hypothetical protein